VLEELTLSIRCGRSLLAVETRDEDRAVEIARQAAVDLSLTTYEWSMTTGLLQTHPARVDVGVGAAKPTAALEHILKNRFPNALYIFKDLGAHHRDPFLLRQLRDIANLQRPTLLLVDADPLPEPVRRLTISLSLKLPEPAELREVVRATFRDVKSQSLQEITSRLTKREMDQLVQALRGLSRADAARVVAAAIHVDNALTAEDLPRILEDKRRLLQTGGCLESIPVNVAVDEIGGLDNLKRWLVQRRGGMTSKAREFGLEPPRGILLLGVQGCGKSLCAKVVAADWNMPLLRMDPGVLYQKFVGESEDRLRASLAQAERMAPAVLWIDEVEKAFASAGSESADGGLSQRMFGTLLTWMQEHASPIFMVATANNLDALPPELMRKGRFDEVFFVDLPNETARQKILEIHLARRKRDPSQFALDELVAVTAGFSGAEIEQLIIAAMYAAFGTGSELREKHLLAQVKNTRPLGVLMRERIEALRAWAHGRCVPAD